MTATMPVRRTEELTGSEREIYERACDDLYDLMVFMRSRGWSGAIVARVTLDGQRVRTQRVNTE